MNHVYNVALNDSTSLNELYQMMKERLVHPNEELKNIKPIYRDFREGDVRHSQANISKAQKLLGYEPEYSISKGMDKAMDWYKFNLS